MGKKKTEIKNEEEQQKQAAPAQEQLKQDDASEQQQKQAAPAQEQLKQDDASEQQQKQAAPAQEQLKQDDAAEQQQKQVAPAQEQPKQDDTVKQKRFHLDNVLVKIIFQGNVNIRKEPSVTSAKLGVTSCGAVHTAVELVQNGVEKFYKLDVGTYIIADDRYVQLID